jgi:hypothetical protein
MLAQRQDESRRLVNGQGAVVLYLGNLAGRREQLVQQAGPPGAVLALTVAGGRGPGQHLFDPPAQPGRGLCLGFPDRPQNVQDVRLGDFSHQDGAHDVG